MALNAEVTLEGVQGTRRMPAASLYRDDGIAYTTKRADEVIMSASAARQLGMHIGSVLPMGFFTNTQK